MRTPQSWSACSPDADRDGISDGDGVVLGTDPSNLDSDGDSLLDPPVDAFPDVESNLRVLTTDGSGGFEVVGETTLPGGARDMVLHDVNGIGTLDVLYGASDGLWVWLSEPPF